MDHISRKLETKHRGFPLLKLGWRRQNVVGQARRFRECDVDYHKQFEFRKGFPIANRIGSRERGIGRLDEYSSATTRVVRENFECQNIGRK